MALASGHATAREPLTVFAAASLTDAITAITDRYTADTGQPVRLSLAGSSTLARQIEAGAPADLFISANLAWLDYLNERGLLDAASRGDLAGNTLVLVAPDKARIGDTADAAVSADLIAVRLGGHGRMVLGDPAHVPAGIYAKAALEKLKIWGLVADRVVYADHVRAALALVGRGEAALGIVYATDAAITDRVVTLARFPEGSHPPIRYGIAVIASSVSPDVLELRAFLEGPAAAEILERYGFVTD